MEKTCPILSPEERAIVAAIAAAEKTLRQSVDDALAAAHRSVEQAFAQQNITTPAPPADYYASVLHQKLFLRLCGADPDTMLGGDPAIARRLLENAQNIVDHYWGPDATDADR